MSVPRPAPPHTAALPHAAAPPRPADEPRVTIEMGGSNIVIRSTPMIDREYTTSLVHAVNAATETGTVVVLDPEPIRCDDSFAGATVPATDTTCPEHARCRPSEVAVVGSGILRIEAECTWWLIDVANGRFCRTDARIDPHFIRSEDWTPVVAVAVTPTRLRALTADGSLVTSRRAHEHRTVEPIAG